MFYPVILLHLVLHDHAMNHIHSHVQANSNSTAVMLDMTSAMAEVAPDFAASVEDSVDFVEIQDVALINGTWEDSIIGIDDATVTDGTEIPDVTDVVDEISTESSSAKIRLLKIWRPSC